ncbi:Npun_F5560 family protein [Myxacorys almedinensis]|uniref:Npun_F5560 family protein n=1 Tax=Myxacorys almedinensis TaxID=2651157 RepID=UPI0030839814
MTDTPRLQEFQAEVVRLQEELQMRDQLVQQLSQELFRLVKGNVNTTAAAVPSQHEPSERHLDEMRALREQLHGIEEQVTFYQGQIEDRTVEVRDLKQSVEELTERSRMLEQVVQELPKIYRQKFAERMAPVKEKVAMIQRENRQLHAELQSVSYRLAVKNRRASDLDLPSFARGDLSLPSFGNA